MTAATITLPTGAGCKKMGTGFSHESCSNSLIRDGFRYRAELPSDSVQTSSGSSRQRPFAPHFIAIRREPDGYGIRFGLTEAEDALLRGPVFETLPEALAWVDHIDEARAA